MTPSASAFDSFAERFTEWTETTNPKQYGQLLGDVVPATVDHALDVGCGAGTLTLWLASRAQRVTGLDLAPAMIDIAGRRRAQAAARNVDFVVGSADVPPFAAGSFDLIVSDAAMHDTELARSLPALRALVRPGGRVVLRDVITDDPVRDRSALHHLVGTLRRVPRYLRQLGPTTAARVLRFEASPTWLRHRAEGEAMTPDAFERTYAAIFPGARFVRQGWCMLMVWDA